MSDLLRLRLSSILHKRNSLWIDPKDGTLYYGKDLDNLIFPGGVELLGKFPKLYLDDIREAFLLGKRSVVEGDPDDL